MIYDSVSLWKPCIGCMLHLNDLLQIPCKLTTSASLQSQDVREGAGRDTKNHSCKSKGNNFWVTVNVIYPQIIKCLDPLEPLHGFFGRCSYEII